MTPAPAPATAMLPRARQIESYRKKSATGDQSTSTVTGVTCEKSSSTSDLKSRIGSDCRFSVPGIGNLRTHNVANLIESIKYGW